MIESDSETETTSKDHMDMYTYTGIGDIPSTVVRVGFIHGHPRYLDKECHVLVVIPLTCYSSINPNIFLYASWWLSLFLLV